MSKKAKRKQVKDQLSRPWSASVKTPSGWLGFPIYSDTMMGAVRQANALLDDLGVKREGSAGITFWNDASDELMPQLTPALAAEWAKRFPGQQVLERLEEYIPHLAKLNEEAVEIQKKQRTAAAEITYLVKALAPLLRPAAKAAAS